MQRETKDLRILALTDAYRSIIATLPRQDAMIDTDAHLNPHILNHLCMSPYASTLDYCVMIYHLLRVGALERAAALVNEMNMKQLSVRAAIRALFAHQLVAAGRHGKAREMLAANVGDPAEPLLIDKANPETERMQAIALPPDVAILLMSPDDSPFFRSDLFHNVKEEKHGRTAKTSTSSVVPWENVLQCFDFLRAGGHLTPHIDCYHHVMRRLAQAGQGAHCRRLFVAMQEDGVTPTTDSYFYLMQALLGERLGAVPLSTLINDRLMQLSDTRRESEAEQVKTVAESRARKLLKLQLLTLHNEMRQKHIAVNEATYSLLIQTCCLVDDERRAWQLVDQLRAAGLRCDTRAVLALLSLSSLTPPRVRFLHSMAFSLDGSIKTCRLFIASAIRRRSGADVLQLLDEVEAGKWKRPIQSTLPVKMDCTPLLAKMYESTTAACNQAGMYDLTTQLFTKIQEADLPTTNRLHLAFVQALCRTGRVSLALAHLEQMPSAFDILPDLSHYCTVMCAAADMPLGEERTYLLTSTARMELFSSLLFKHDVDEGQSVSLVNYSADEDALVVTRGLLLWMQHVGSERFGERIVTGAHNADCAVQLSTTAAQYQSGLCSKVKALLDASLSAATAQSLVWDQRSEKRWTICLSVSAANEVRGRAERERGPVSAQQGESSEHVEELVHSDDESQPIADLTTISTTRRTWSEQPAP